MATDVEKLVVQLSADIRQYQREMLKAQGVSTASARKIERTYLDMNKRLDAIGRASASAIVAPLSGIAATLAVKEVLGYADAWTKAKNSLAVAGVVGENQAEVLDRIYKSAQANAAPIGALAGLYGKAAQANDNLNASQEDLLRFTDGIATALRVEGKSAAEASGALTQLGQLLGSARVQAEEFNSINEGARPILMAVAKGLDEAGGSVSRLKQLVNDGKVSGKQFFEAFLKGLPEVKKMAANSAQTIEQGYTKINNALTRYIGQTDSSLGASQRLVQGLNALADNFDQTADTVLQLAAVIAGALVGRSLAGMIAKLGLTAVALKQFITLARAAQAAAAFRGLASAAGPIGAVVGVAATAVALFASSADSAVPSSEAYARALEKVRSAAEDAGEAVEEAAQKLDERQRNEILIGIEENKKDIEEARAAVLKYFADIQQNAPRRLVSEEQLKSLDDLKRALQDGSKSAQEVDNEIAALANANPKFQTLADQMKPLLARLIELVGASKELQSNLSKLDGPSLPGASPGNLGAVFLERQRRQDILDQRLADAGKSDAEREIEARVKSIAKTLAEANLTMSDAALRAAAKAELAVEAGTKGLDSTISGYVNRVIGAESGGDTNAKNPLSSATGLGQFIESTWLNLFRKHFPDRAEGMSREAILALRTDAATSKQMIEAYARENAAILQKAGVSVNEAALHLAHFLGPAGAAKVLSAAPGTPIAGLLDAGAIRANPTILGNGATVDSVRAYAERRAGMTTPGTQAIDARVDFEKQIEQERQRLELLKQETGLRAQLNPLVNDYGRALSEIEKASELLKLAQQEGTAAGRELSGVQQLLKGDLSTLTPEAQKQALAMRALAVDTGAATAAGNQLDAAQERLKSSLSESSALGKDVFGGMIRGLRDGASAAEIMHGALIKISDKLLDMALTQMFDGAVAGSGGGLLGALFKPLLGSFDRGGYTGPGGKNDIAGLVHAGEYVVPKKMVDRIGVPALEAMMRGYTNGGPVLRAPSMPSIEGYGRPAAWAKLMIGVEVDQNGTIAPYVARIAQQTTAREVRVGIDRYDRTKAPMTAVNSMREYQERMG